MCSANEGLSILNVSQNSILSHRNVASYQVLMCVHEHNFGKENLCKWRVQSKVIAKCYFR